MVKINKNEGAGGPWGGGSGGNNSGNDNNGSGRSSSGGGGGGNRGRGPNAGDFEEWIAQLQRRLNRSFFGRGNSIRFLLIALVLFGIWVGSGIYRVLPDEEGVVTLFGAYNRSAVPGLHYHLPTPIEQVQTPKVTIVNRVDIGMRVFEQSSVFGSSTLPSQTRDVPEESLMLTGDENIVDVDFSVFWVINSAKDFLFNVQNPVGAVKVVAESVMREIVGKNKIQPILTDDRQRIEEDVKALMQKTLNEYGVGVEIRQVKMQKVDPPGAVIDSFRDVQAARADQERIRNEAQTYRNRVVPEARGEAAKLLLEAEAYRERTVAESEGEAVRFLAIYNEYRNAASVTRKRIYLETMEKILKDADKIVIDQKNGSGVVPYLPLEQLKKNKGEKK